MSSRKLSNDLPGVVDCQCDAGGQRRELNSAEGAADVEETVWYTVVLFEVSNDLPGVVDAKCGSDQLAGDINGAEGAADIEETV